MGFLALFQREGIKKDTESLRTWASKTGNAFARSCRPGKIDEKDFKEKHEKMLHAFNKLMNDEAEHLLRKLKEEKLKNPNVWIKNMDDDAQELYGHMIRFGLWIEENSK
ncbi:hypothetical protein JXB27_00955 [Candidatus Woesearchaeota archaeon]|nr:hypothetical protein [Candidatus Woesearchaeota archaeon]